MRNITLNPYLYHHLLGDIVDLEVQIGVVGVYIGAGERHHQNRCRVRDRSSPPLFLSPKSGTRTHRSSTIHNFSSLYFFSFLMFSWNDAEGGTEEGGEFKKSNLTIFK
jgi:hypothetical protein